MWCLIETHREGLDEVSIDHAETFLYQHYGAKRYKL
jgi:hypothetical protein